MVEENAGLIKTLGTINNLYLNWIDEILEESGGRACNNFTDITLNLLGVMHSTKQLCEDNNKPWEEEREEYLKYGGALKDYLQLIKNFKEFRESELKKEKDWESVQGLFGYQGGVMEYVEYARFNLWGAGGKSKGVE